MKEIAVVNGQLIFVDGAKDGTEAKLQVRALLDIVTAGPLYCLDSQTGEHYLDTKVHQLEFSANIEQVFAMAANFTAIGNKMQQAQNKIDKMQQVTSDYEATAKSVVNPSAELPDSKNDDTGSPDTNTD